MDAKNGNMMRYIWGSVGLIGLLAVIVWGVAKASFFAGYPTEQACLICDQNVCPATTASWRELFNKMFGDNALKNK